eukprot:477949_1
MCVSEESIVKKEYEIKEPDVSLSEDVIRNNIISKGSAGILLSEDISGSKVPLDIVSYRNKYGIELKEPDDSGGITHECNINNDEEKELKIFVENGDIMCDIA